MSCGYRRDMIVLMIEWMINEIMSIMIMCKSNLFNKDLRER